MEYMNDYDPKMIGKRIKETAQSKGYTAEKLSEITGNGIHTINRIYQGTSISTEYICQLSQVLEWRENQAGKKFSKFLAG